MDEIPLDLLSFLSSVELFGRISPSAVREIARQLEVLSLSKGQVLSLTSSACGEDLYVVIEGTVAVVISDSEDHFRFQGAAGPADAVGGWPLAPGDGASRQFFVLQDSVVGRLSTAAFQALAGRYPEDAIRLAEAASRLLCRSRLRLALHFSDLAEGMDSASLRYLEAELELVTFASGAVLMRQGDAAECLYIVINGRVRVAGRTEEGEEAISTELGPGEIVGEMGLLSGASRTATVTAIRDTVAARLDKRGFDRFVSAHPQAALGMFTNKLVNRLSERASTRAPRRRRNLTFAVLAARSDVPICEFARRFSTAVSRLGTTLHLDSRRVDTILGGAGTAQALENSARNARLVEWLNEQELRHQYLVYECDTSTTQWTRRALRQADHILLVGRDTSEPSQGELETQLCPAHSDTQISLVLLRGSQPYSGTSRWLKSLRVQRHFHVRLDVAADCERVARFLTGRAFGLVLGGGFARGLVHIGVLQALAERGIEVDAIGGNSMGAVLAAQFAQGWDFERMLRETAEGCAACIHDMTLPLIAFKSGARFSALIRKFTGDIQIEDLRLPYFCVSANLNRAELHVHKQGPLTKAILASSRVPGVFPPVIYDGEMHIDGGILNNVPVDIMRRFAGDGIVVGVDAVPNRQFGAVFDYGFEMNGWQALWKRWNPFSQPSPVPNILQIMLRTMEFGGVYQKRILAEAADLYLRPPLQGFKPTDFRLAAGIVDVGYRTAQKAIQDWLDDPEVPAERKPA